jgi:hypothetical protein
VPRANPSAASGRLADILPHGKSDFRACPALALT